MPQPPAVKASRHNICTPKKALYRESFDDTGFTKPYTENTSTKKKKEGIHFKESEKREGKDSGGAHKRQNETKRETFRGLGTAIFKTLEPEIFPPSFLTQSNRGVIVQTGDMWLARRR